MYKHICTMCGDEFENGSKKQYMCEKCNQKLQKMKKHKMLDKAEHRLTHFKAGGRKNNLDLAKEVSAVRSRMEDGIDNFSSEPEAMVAIQLEHRNVRYETQKKIAEKRVDFYLPDMKIVLEIDGELFHTDTNEAFIRDRAIMREIGEEWEIVHIEASSVPRFTWNLQEALPFIISERNSENRFRNSEFDEYYLEKHYSFVRFMRGGR